MSQTLYLLKQMAAADADGIALSQSPAAAALTLNGAFVSGGVATIDTATAANTALGRRVIITSGGNDTGITWAVVGTNASGTAITDTFAGANAGAAQSNLDFLTVTSITPSGAAASTVTAGTNGVGASAWRLLNPWGKSPMDVSLAAELVSGSANYTVQYTYDDPTRLPSGLSVPLAFSHADMTGKTATAEAVIQKPVAAVRLLINSGEGALRMRILQAGVG
jgi:hypothetical protein